MHWPMGTLRSDVPFPWLDILLVLAAVICGAIVGTERARQDKPAGLRTLILVCLGSTLFTMVSFTFTTTTGDSGRVAAQIVTGIGFLGAGAILHSRTTVSGMTTAAAIWIMAAIGVTVGVGRPVEGVGLALLVRVILAGVRQWEVRHLGGYKSVSVEILFDPEEGKTRIRLDCIREEYHVSGPLAIESSADAGLVRGRLDVQLPRRHLHEFLREVVDLPAVRAIREIRTDMP